MNGSKFLQENPKKIIINEQTSLEDCFQFYDNDLCRHHGFIQFEVLSRQANKEVFEKNGKEEFFHHLLQKGPASRCRRMEQLKTAPVTSRFCLSI